MSKRRKHPDRSPEQRSYQDKVVRSLIVERSQLRTSFNAAEVEEKLSLHSRNLLPILEAAVSSNGEIANTGRRQLSAYLTSSDRAETIDALYSMAFAAIIRYNSPQLSPEDIDTTNAIERLIVSIMHGDSQTQDILSHSDPQLYMFYMPQLLTDPVSLARHSSLEVFDLLVSNMHLLFDQSERIRIMQEITESPMYAHINEVALNDLGGNYLREQEQRIQTKVNFFKRLYSMSATGNISPEVLHLLHDPFIMTSDESNAVSSIAALRLRDYFNMDETNQNTYALLATPARALHTFILDKKYISKGFKGLYKHIVERSPQFFYRDEADTVLDPFTGALTLEYLRDYSVPEEQTADVQLQTVAELQSTKRTRWVSLRGESITITDPQLRQDGYKRIFYTFQPNRSMGVEIFVGNYSIQCTINRNFELVFPNDIETIMNPAAKQWWETVLLLHIKPVLTGEKRAGKGITELQLQDEQIKVEEAEEGEAEIIDEASGSAHEIENISTEDIQELRFRRHPLRSGYTFRRGQAVVVWILAGENLAKINKIERAQTGRSYTWLLPGIRRIVNEMDPHMRVLIEASTEYHRRHRMSFKILAEWLTANKNEILRRLNQGRELTPIQSSFPHAMDPLR